MADKHPYFQSPGNFIQLITHLRRTFPNNVSAETLKKLGIAPKNESYIVNTLRYLGLIDDEGNKTDLAGEVFSQHADEGFHKAFAPVVKEAYPDLFALHGDGAWDLDRDQLITFFRQADQSSASVGGYQASTFSALAGLAGHGDVPEARAKKQAKPKPGKVTGSKTPEPKPTPPKPATPGEPVSKPALKVNKGDVGLTVRVEINLPAEGDQATYDRIFKSIRENLLNG